MSQPSVKFRKSEWIDLILLVPRLRKADVDECEAMFGKGSLSRVATQTFKGSSMKFTVDVDGVPIAMFGMYRQTMLSDSAQPWMFGTPAIDKHLRRALIEDARGYISDMLRLARRLENVVDARNKTSIRWLTHLGFKILPAIPMGVSGAPFHPFVMEV